MFSIFKKKSKLVTDLKWLSVDVHSHLLPGIDDGSPDVQTSIALIRGLNQLGLRKFICTPHIFTELYPNNRQTIAAALDVVKEKIKDTELDVEVDMAAEYMIDGDFKLDGDLLTMPGKYILIEMSYLNETPNIEQVIFDLQIKGHVVMLAHPERYNFYHGNLARYHRLKDMGCMFQLNLLSITGYYGKEVGVAADYMLKHKMYDFAGTDLHHEKHLKVLSEGVKSGRVHKYIGDYPFKNHDVFD